LNSTENISTAPSETGRKVNIREQQNLLLRIKDVEQQIKAKKRDIEKVRTFNQNQF